MSQRRLMSVKSDLVRETVVETICERALAQLDRRVPAPVATALDAAAHAELARAGYFARIAEAELFEPARRPTPGLSEELGRHATGDSAWPGAVMEVASGLAEREPLERPEPDDPEAFSWRVPGPGGHVRHYVALRLIDSGDRGIKRDFVYGFAVRCCEEVSPP